MPIKIKERTNNKILVRCNNPFELQWFMQMMAGMRGKSPITSVQKLDGKEVQLPSPPQIQQPTVVDNKATVVKVPPAEIIKPPIVISPEEKKDDKPISDNTSGKTG